MLAIHRHKWQVCELRIYLPLLTEVGSGWPHDSRIPECLSADRH